MNTPDEIISEVRCAVTLNGGPERLVQLALTEKYLTSDSDPEFYHNLFYLLAQRQEWDLLLAVYTACYTGEESTRGILSYRGKGIISRPPKILHSCSPWRGEITTCFGLLILDDRVEILRSLLACSKQLFDDSYYADCSLNTYAHYAVRINAREIVYLLLEQVPERLSRSLFYDSLENRRWYLINHLVQHYRKFLQFNMLFDSTIALEPFQEILDKYQVNPFHNLGIGINGSVITSRKHSDIQDPDQFLAKCRYAVEKGILPDKSLKGSFLMYGCFSSVLLYLKDYLPAEVLCDLDQDIGLFYNRIYELTDTNDDGTLSERGIECLHALVAYKFKPEECYKWVLEVIHRRIFTVLDYTGENMGTLYTNRVLYVHGELHARLPEYVYSQPRQFKRVSEELDFDELIKLNKAIQELQREITFEDLTTCIPKREEMDEILDVKRIKVACFIGKTLASWGIPLVPVVDEVPVVRSIVDKWKRDANWVRRRELVALRYIPDDGETCP